MEGVEGCEGDVRGVCEGGGEEVRCGGDKGGDRGGGGGVEGYGDDTEQGRDYMRYPLILNSNLEVQDQDGVVYGRVSDRGLGGKICELLNLAFNGCVGIKAERLDELLRIEGECVGSGRLGELIEAERKLKSLLSGDYILEGNGNLSQNVGSSKFLKKALKKQLRVERLVRKAERGRREDERLKSKVECIGVEGG